MATLPLPADRGDADKLYLEDFAKLAGLTFHSARTYRTKGKLPEPDGYNLPDGADGTKVLTGGPCPHCGNQMNPRPWWYRMTVLEFRAKRPRPGRRGRTVELSQTG